jgi:hypothetical protein
MLSRICKQRNEVIIPRLLGQYDAVITAAPDIVDLSTAENYLLMDDILKDIPKLLDPGSLTHYVWKLASTVPM